MLSIGDESIFERAEQQNPSSKKSVNSNRAIFTSRKLRLPKDMFWGQPVLYDLGQARIGEVHTGLIQPDIYKAPEVLFDMERGHSADVWNLGVMTWDIFEKQHLFNALDENGEYSPSHHVAWMVAFLGLPPLSFISRSPDTRNVFSDDGESYFPLSRDQADDCMGKWLGAGGINFPTVSLERLEERLSGRGQKSFLQFMRSMLQWVLEKGKTAKKLLEDPWLNSTS